MIAYLDGTLEEKNPTGIVLDLGGVGYEITIPLCTYDALPPTGQRCRVLVHEVLREDAHLLFGFATETDRRLFRLLIEVSGIGPKIALSALSGLSSRELMQAISERDARRLARISGVGKKTAERIVVELADKIDPLEALSAGSGGRADAPGALTAPMRDAILALCALGHPQDAALKRVRQASGDGVDPADTEALIKAALSQR